jgi:kinesin family protein 6/9
VHSFYCTYLRGPHPAENRFCFWLLHLQVSVNEEVDPAAIIRRLKQEVRDLKDELQLLKGGAAQRGPLTPDELLRLRQQLLAFVADSSAGASLNLGGDMMMIRASEFDC